MTVDWKPFDYADKRGTAPPMDELVWVHEEYYYSGVAIGYFDGFTMCLSGGNDDCHVTHWAPLDFPQPPEGDK